MFVLNNSKTWFRQCNGDVNVTSKVFTLSDITSEPILKLEEQNDERQSSEVVGPLMNSTCRDHLVFYNVSVQVPCVEVTFNIKTLKDESRNYSTKVCNTFGCDFSDIIVISTGTYICLNPCATLYLIYFYFMCQKVRNLDVCDIKRRTLTSFDTRRHALMTLH